MKTNRAECLQSLTRAKALANELMGLLYRARYAVDLGDDPRAGFGDGIWDYVATAQNHLETVKNQIDTALKSAEKLPGDSL